jgi:hypothetical protein
MSNCCKTTEKRLNNYIPRINKITSHIESISLNVDNIIALLIYLNNNKNFFLYR